MEDLSQMPNIEKGLEEKLLESKRKLKDPCIDYDAEGNELENIGKIREAIKDVKEELDAIPWYHR